jgi:hypothetical protein
LSLTVDITPSQDGPANAYLSFKFAITMENTRAEGWLNEKLFNAVLAHSVPIYFGASDVGKYINLDRIVWFVFDTK